MWVPVNPSKQQQAQITWFWPIVNNAYSLTHETQGLISKILPNSCDFAWSMFELTGTHLCMLPSVETDVKNRSLTRSASTLFCTTKSYLLRVFMLDIRQKCRGGWNPPWGTPCFHKKTSKWSLKNSRFLQTKGSKVKAAILVTLSHHRWEKITLKNVQCGELSRDKQRPKLVPQCFQSQQNWCHWSDHVAW